MKIMTLNMNGIRSATQKGFFTWLQQTDIDIICLQETRAQVNLLQSQYPEFFPGNYHCYYLDANQKGYSGVGILSKIKPKHVNYYEDGHLFNHEGRYLQIDFEKLSIVSLYLPSGTSGEERQTIKYDCMAHLYIELTKIIKQKREYIICGDWNIAHKPIDLKNWRSNQKNTGFLPEERAWLDKVFHELGLVDGFRVVNQEADQYTWWSNRGQAYVKNVGWRIDYQVTTQGVASFIQQAEIYKQQRFSDHAPLILEYHKKLVELI